MRRFVCKREWPRNCGGVSTGGNQSSKRCLCNRSEWSLIPRKARENTEDKIRMLKER